MGRLIYTAIMSLDGYVADEGGGFGWAEPDEEVHTFVNDLERSVGTYLYGRRMYETMSAWDHPEVAAGRPAHIRDFATIWQAAEKVVYSTTLESVSTARTRLERGLDAESVRQTKTSAGHDLTIGGPTLASHALAADLVDECQLFLAPIMVGGGTPGLPAHVRLPLELVQERRFGNGMVFLRYRTAG